MLDFWFKATWRDLDGWEVTGTFNRYASSKKEAVKLAKICLKWFDEKLPSSFHFIGMELIKVDEVLGTEPIEMEEI